MLTIIFLLIGALVLAWLLTGKKSVPEWMPEELKGAKEHSEIKLKAKLPDGNVLVGRSDRVFETKGGLVVMDYKTRKAHRTYQEDILEISAYGLLLKANGKRVKDHGYIVTDDGREKRTHKVNLMTTQEVAYFVDRFAALRAGKSSGCKTSMRAKCRSCGHQKRCSEEVGEPFAEKGVSFLRRSPAK